MSINFTSIQNSKLNDRSLTIGCISVFTYSEKRLQWSRGSALAFGTQVRGFKPGRNRRIFQGEKILSTPPFGREVKPFVPCRICKKNPKVYAWKSQLSVEITGHFSPK